MLKILVLGSAAGGGSPQWNCNSNVSKAVRKGGMGVSPRTQSSIAVTADGDQWFLFNASPDLGSQILNNKQMHPKKNLRHSPISGVVLTNGDVDHVAGLLTLRERQNLAVYAHKRVHSVLKENTIFNVLNPDYVDRREMKMNQKFELKNKEGKGVGIEVEAFEVPGKIALWLEDESKGKDFGTEDGDTIGLKISSKNNKESFYYIPACASMTNELSDKVKGSEIVLFDGTLWTNDEMASSNVGQKTGQRMGHMNNSGEDGSIHAFKNLDVKRKIFIHINTTNPILLPDSDERKIVEQSGWEVSYDGMEINL
ncbi:MAG: pyrroloquinoline quinone biosynthesis protein PqqB [Pelagibacteraceae bacterium TMED65]|nr:pyrroloquinoline quinone biosynthesis protein PqqB [Rickettsiales bacterium]OUU51766.1 MAG: pyrroloquinoline quinone biosynthesis protein PqqB [Pelagibacteraceae bacterium TMED65]|tara:strand:+ start:315 stop:1247 length:933 start_codon:yes stop_codon:yes gene_type:complete